MKDNEKLKTKNVKLGSRYATFIIGHKVSPKFFVLRFSFCAAIVGINS